MKRNLVCKFIFWSLLLFWGASMWLLISTEVEASFLPMQVSFNGEKISNKHKENLLISLKARLEDWKKTKITFSYKNKQIELLPSEVGINPSIIDESIDFSVIGRFQTMIDPYEVSIEPNINNSAMTDKINTIFSEDFQEMTYPEIVYNESTGMIDIQKERIGIRLDTKKLENLLNYQTHRLSSNNINIPVIIERTFVIASDIEPYINRINNLANENKIFVYDNKYGDLLIHEFPNNYRNWVEFEIDEEKMTYWFDLSISMGEFIQNEIEPKIYSERKDLILEYPENINEIQKINLNEKGNIRDDGFEIDYALTYQNFYEKINDLEDSLEGGLRIYTKKDSGKVVLGGKELERLGLGRSDYTGSVEGRAHNIRLGLNEKFNLIYIPNGEEFQFNQLVGPLTYYAGWKDSLGIFGSELRATIAGGLCQVATTVYRSVVDSGADVSMRYPHSMYVHYYDKYGKGLDAAVFAYGPNKQWGKDVRFTNNTEAPMILISKTEGNVGVTEIYGIDDGREVEVEGPFIYPFKELTERGFSLPTVNKRTIYWVQTKKIPGREIEENLIQSTYGTSFQQIIRETDKKVVGIGD